MIYTDNILSYQWDVFSKSIALGLLLGGCFDIFKAAKIILRFGKKVVFVWDMLYCFWAGFLMFSFLLNENFGFPRLYIFFGAAIGFSAWYFTFGKISAAAAKIIRKILCAILKPFEGIFRKILKIIKKRAEKVKIFSSKATYKYKKLLKKKNGWVYNILCLNISKAFSVCGGKAGKEHEKVESNGTEKNEEESFSSDGNSCLRCLYPLFTDIDSGEHQQETGGT